MLIRFLAVSGGSSPHNSYISASVETICPDRRSRQASSDRHLVRPIVKAWLRRLSQRLTGRLIGRPARLLAAQLALNRHLAISFSGSAEDEGRAEPLVRTGRLYGGTVRYGPGV